MSENNAKIRISVKDGEFEISGSELFVSQQIENFKEQIVLSLQNNKFEADIKPDLFLSESSEVPSTDGSITKLEMSYTENKYSRVLHIEDNLVKIIKKIPGKSNQARTISTALVYAYGKSTLGIYDVPTKEISEQCKEQSCLDSANFSSHLKGAKEYFIQKGNKINDKTIKLTIPGKEEAERILNELNS